jgi:hypothetical protein
MEGSRSLETELLELGVSRVEVILGAIALEDNGNKQEQELLVRFLPKFLWEVQGRVILF